MFGIEDAALDVVEAELLCSATGNLDHRAGEVADDHPSGRSNERSRGEPDHSRASRQIEDRVSRRRVDQLEHLFGYGPSDLFEVSVTFVPARRHCLPHGVARALVIGPVHTRLEPNQPHGFGEAAPVSG
jgi:hypothetical protein